MLLAPIQSRCSDVLTCRPKPGAPPAVPAGDNTHRLSPHLFGGSLNEKKLSICLTVFTQNTTTQKSASPNLHNTVRPNQLRPIRALLMSSQASFASAHRQESDMHSKNSHNVGVNRG